MGRAGITYLEVSTVANQLVTAGRNPTVDAVREALGGTGSKSTLAPLLKRWKTEHGAHGAELTSRLPAPLLQAVVALHEQAQADADRRIQETLDAHAEATADWQSRLDQTATRYAAVVQERDAVTRQVDTLKQQEEHWRRQHHEQQLQLARLEAETASGKERLQERQLEVVAVTQQLQQLRQQYEHYQEAVADQRDTERQQAQQARTDLEQELGALRTELNHTRQLLAERSTQLDAARHTQQQQETELAVIRERFQREQADRQLITGQQEYLINARNGAQQLLASCQAELELLRRRHTETNHQLSVLQQENRDLLQAKAMLATQLQMRSKS